jgi:hypothetical protein
LWKGGAPERIASATLLIAATLSLFVRQPVATQFQSIETGVFIVDLGLLGVMVALAILSERFWPLWMAAMAAIAALTHVSMLLKLDLMAWAYWRSQALWSYPMQLLLALATWRHQSRLKRFGVDRCWRPSFSR